MINKNPSANVHRIFLIFLDLALVYISFSFSYWIQTEGLSLNLGIKIDNSLIFFLFIISFFSFYLFDLYVDWRRKNIRNLLFSVFLSSLTSAGLMLVMLMIKGAVMSIPFVIAVFCMQTVMLCTARFLLWHQLKRIYANKKVLIIGADYEMNLRMADKFLGQKQDWFIISDFLPIAKKEFFISKLQSVDAVLIAPEVNKHEASEIVSLCVRNEKEVLIVPHLFELFIAGSEPEQIDDMLVLSIKPPVLNQTQNQLKRISDVIVSAAMLILATPIMFTLFTLIPLTSKGSAIFKQERIGQNGKPYLLYKFRSMVQDAEIQTGPVLASDKDPRITKLGSFMRATRVDEIPQLFNVLKGDMSLIGPRPEREFFIKKFERDIPDYKYRLRVKPGITGLAQVLANYTTSVEDKLRYDLMYVRNYSFMLDLKIFLQTIRVVLQRDQAQGLKEENMLRKQKLIQTLE
jgi:exopolysaccharide biosynthesis polyprenyl glycosylphosphotransferase